MNTIKHLGFAPIIIVIVLLLSLSVGLLLLSNKPIFNQSKPTSTTSPTSSASQAPKWEEYKNASFKYQISYPPDIFEGKKSEDPKLGNFNIVSIEGQSTLFKNGTRLAGLELEVNPISLVDKEEYYKFIKKLSELKTEGSIDATSKLEAIINPDHQPPSALYFTDKDKDTTHLTTYDLFTFFPTDINDLDRLGHNRIIYFVTLKSDNKKDLFSQVDTFKKIVSSFQFLPIPSESAVIITLPQPDSLVKSPAVIAGKINKSWTFESNFFVEIQNQDRVVIASTPVYATFANENANFGEFNISLSFSPNSDTGFLVIKNDNPSGLPERNEQFEIPIKLAR